MNRKMISTMLVLAIALVAVPGTASAAVASPYAVPEGEAESFVVMGNDASLVQTTGEAFITHKTPLPGGFLDVRVFCAEGVLCTGVIVAS